MLNNKLAEELKEKNYLLFKKKLEQIGIDTSLFDESIKSKLINATFSISNDSATYEGSLLETVLRVLTPNAIRINDLLPNELKVETNTLIKISLLIHLSKCEMFMLNDNEWEVEKMNKIFKYAPSTVALKMGMKSLILAQNLGIKFSPTEIEAMTSLDRENDEQLKFFASPLSVVIKQANDLTLLIIRNTK